MHLDARRNRTMGWIVMVRIPASQRMMQASHGRSRRHAV
jgi:hypothetical protein